ncbi:MAG: hypothetical protein LBU87_03540 [Lactobacillales bacterium]|nr:hypothetical protein [Lactobacillales bacterium]
MIQKVVIDLPLPFLESHAPIGDGSDEKPPRLTEHDFTSSLAAAAYLLAPQGDFGKRWEKFLFQKYESDVLTVLSIIAKHRSHAQVVFDFGNDTGVKEPVAGLLGRVLLDVGNEGKPLFLRLSASRKEKAWGLFSNHDEFKRDFLSAFYEVPDTTSAQSDKKFKKVSLFTELSNNIQQDPFIKELEPDDLKNLLVRDMEPVGKPGVRQIDMLDSIPKMHCLYLLAPQHYEEVFETKSTAMQKTPVDQLTPGYQAHARQMIAKIRRKGIFPYGNTRSGLPTASRCS